MFASVTKKQAIKHSAYSISSKGSSSRSIFKQSTAGLNSEFSFLIGWLTKAKEISLPYCLFRAGRRRDGYLSFPRALV